MKSYLPFIKIISAVIIDYFIALIVNAFIFIFLNIITGEHTTDLLVYTYMLILTLYKITFEYLYKQTIGKKIFNIYVTAANGINEISFINILIRNYYLVLILVFQFYSLFSYYKIFGLESINFFIENYPKYTHENLNHLKFYHFVIIIEIIFLGIHKGEKSLHDKPSSTKLIIASKH